MRRTVFLVAIFSTFLSAIAPTVHAVSAELREGIDYVRINPPQPQSGPGIEVVEFFSYGCPHCNDFEPSVAKWRAGLPKDVHFRRVPISFGRPQWKALAKLYLALVATGNLGKVDKEVFDAIHREKLPLTDDRAVLDWAVKKVADPKTFSETYGSFGIQAGVASSDRMGLDAGISGVPAIAVGGRYLVVGKEVKSYQDILAIADRLIEMVRKSPQR